jgi:hypothetical protein
MNDSRFRPAFYPVRVILDTDMATDCDDAGAMAVLHALSAKGEAEILAIVTNNKGDASIGAVAALNAFYGKNDIPLGAYQEDIVGIESSLFVQELAADTATYGHAVTTRAQVPTAVEVYRQTLANSPDGSVVIISIGHLNNLSDLLHSGPDRHSLLAGPELVKQKVARMVVMGGEYPSGKEHNFAARESATYAAHVIEEWPTPMIFTGFTLGERINTGPGLATLGDSNPVRRAYAGHPSNPLKSGRASWDQTAVVAAVRGPEVFWNLSAPGRNHVQADGSNHWHDDPNGTQVYLIERDDPGKVAQEIEGLMMGL